MKTYFVISHMVFLSILNACNERTNDISQEKVTDTSNMNMTPKHVLQAHLAQFPLFEDAIIVRVSDLDVLSYTGFSVTPKSTGHVAEVFYLVKNQEVLSTGSNTLDIVMKEVIESNETLDIHKFASLFCRFKVLRYGEVLDKHDGNVLMKPGQLPESDFSPPSMSREGNGLHYTFWIFDARSFIPVYYDVHVKDDGQIEYETEELE